MSDALQQPDPAEPGTGRAAPSPREGEGIAAQAGPVEPSPAESRKTQRFPGSRAEPVGKDGSGRGAPDAEYCPEQVVAVLLGIAQTKKPSGAALWKRRLQTAAWSIRWWLSRYPTLTAAVLWTLVYAGCVTLGYWNEPKDRVLYMKLMLCKYEFGLWHWLGLVTGGLAFSAYKFSGSGWVKTSLKVNALAIVGYVVVVSLGTWGEIYYPTSRKIDWQAVGDAALIRRWEYVSVWNVPAAIGLAWIVLGWRPPRRNEDELQATVQRMDTGRGSSEVGQRRGTKVLGP